MMAGPIGTALTEVPALLFFCASLALLFPALDLAGRGRPSAYAAAVAAGLCLGIAVLGRQQFLVAAITAAVLVRRRTWGVGLIYALLGVAVPLPVFLVWGGLVPPRTQAIEAGLSAEYALFAFSYAGVAYCLYDVSWILRRWRGFAAAVALGALANVAAGAFQHYPFHVTAARALSPRWLELYGLATTGAMLGFGAGFLALLASFAWQYRGDPAGLFACAAAAGLLAGSARGHMFAGRYIATSLPLLVVLAAGRVPDTYGKAARLAVGCAGGVVALLAYFKSL
jgi:hypothetical protein